VIGLYVIGQVVRIFILSVCDWAVRDRPGGENIPIERLW
jgi:hypothetical protein